MRTHGFLWQIILLLSVSNQSAFAVESLSGNVEKFSTDSDAEMKSLKGSAGNSGASLSADLSKDSNSALHGGTGSNNLSAGTNSDSNKGLTGGVSKSSAASITLQGGIEDGGTLNHSTKLIPDKASKPIVLNGDAKKLTAPIGAAPGTPRKPVPFFPPSTEPAFVPGTPHIISPISSYGMSPRIGIFTTPGYNIPSVQSVKGVTSYVPGFEVNTVKTNQNVINNVQHLHHSEGTTSSNGVTSYVPGYGIGALSHYDYTLSGGGGGGNAYASKSGVTTYIAGFDTGVTSSTNNTVNNYAATNTLKSDSSTVTTRSGITSYIPGFEVTLATSPKVTNTWHPGLVETVAMGDYDKNTISGVWYSPTATETMPQLVAGAESLPANRIYVQPILAPDNQGLKATAQVLTTPQSSMGSEWDSWYEKVGRSIYGRWERADVGPGSATVRVTIDRSRNMACEVVSFRPALYTDHDTAAETAFRITALRAANDLSQYEIPELPPLAPHKYSVTFDLEMARAITGPSGFIVAAPRK